MKTWVEHIDVLRAEEQMQEMVTASVPWMETEDRDETIARLQQAAGLEVTPRPSDGETISMEDFRAEIKRGING